MTRRGWLLAGGATVLVTGLGATGAVWYPGGGPPRQPWKDAGKSLGDPRLDALSYAILAPNPHNRQPWTFELVGTDRIDVRCDLERRLPHTDPFDRQIVIGFGCMLELLRMAAAEQGQVAEITPFPDGDPQTRLDGGRIASVQFRPDPTVDKDPLFKHIPDRRSCKEPFDLTKPVLAADAKPILLEARGNIVVGEVLNAEDVARVIDLTWRAWLIEYETDRTRRESIDLMRIGNAAVARNPDGIDLGGLGMGAMGMAGMMSPKALDTKGEIAYETGISIYDAMLHATPAFVWLGAADNTRKTQLDAGSVWVRTNLAATAAGLSFHPVSQALQEYPEMASCYEEATEMFRKAPTWFVHMLARVGYGPRTQPAPRWPLQAKLIQAGA